MTPIEYEYRGVTITFNENTERWCAKINGVERSREKLHALKELIDAPPKEKFCPKTALLWTVSTHPPKQVRVTSKAESGYTGPRYRLSTGEIEYARNLYQDTTGNTSLFASIRELDEKMCKLAGEKGQLVGLLERFTP